MWNVCWFAYIRPANERTSFIGLFIVCCAQKSFSPLNIYIYIKMYFILIILRAVPNLDQEFITLDLE